MPAMKKQFQVACSFQELPIFAVCNHGVPEDIVEGQFAQSHAFFAMPLEEKLKIKVMLRSQMTGLTLIHRDSVYRMEGGPI